MKKALRVFGVLLSLVLFACGGGGGGGSSSSSSSDSSASASTQNQPPVITLSADNLNPQHTSPVTFIISASDPDGDALTITCDLDGDGAYETTASGTTVVHTFSIVGTYNVTCMATDPSGLSATSAVVSIISTQAIGDVTRSLPFPAGYVYVSDVAYDKSSQSLWVMAFTDLNCTNGAIINIDYQTGATIKIIDIGAYNTDTLICNTEFTVAGDYIFSLGWSLNGDTNPTVSKFDKSGNLIETFICPATTGNECKGITWDGTYLWVGTELTRNIVQISTSGSIITTLSNVFNTTGITDLSYIAATGELMVVNSSIYNISPTSGSILSQSTPSGNGSVGAGDWDGSVYWTANYSQQQIDGLYIGQ
jgi:hypothetical protein